MATFQFEKKIQALESLVQEMEQDDLSLEKSMANFEKGIKIVRECQGALQEAEQKIEILQQGTLNEFKSED